MLFDCVRCSYLVCMIRCYRQILAHRNNHILRSSWYIFQIDQCSYCWLNTHLYLWNTIARNKFVRQTFRLKLTRLKLDHTNLKDYIESLFSDCISLAIGAYWNTKPMVK